MSKIKKYKYTVTLDKKVVDKAKEELEVGQKLSPVINQLLKEWIQKKKKRGKI